MNTKIDGNTLERLLAKAIKDKAFAKRLIESGVLVNATSVGHIPDYIAYLLQQPQWLEPTKKGFHLWLDDNTKQTPMQTSGDWAAMDRVMMEVNTSPVADDEAEMLLKQLQEDKKRVAAVEQLKSGDYRAAAETARGTKWEAKVNAVAEKHAEKTPTPLPSEPVSYSDEEIPIPSGVMPESIIRLATYYATEIGEQPSGHHLMAALWSMGVVVGKRVEWHNKGRDYTPSLWMVILAPSGDSKSNLVEAVEKAVAAAIGTDVPFETVVSTTMEGFAKNMGDFLPNLKPHETKAERAAWKREKAEIAKNFREHHNFVCSEFRGLFHSLIPKQSGDRYMPLLCNLVLDNPSTWKNETSGNGSTYIFYPSVHLFGVCTDDDYNNEMGDILKIRNGVAARILPYNKRVANITFQPIPTTKMEAIKILSKIRNAAIAMGTVKAIEHDECIKASKNYIASMPPVVSYATRYPREWECQQNKALVQGVKLYCIAEYVREAESGDIAKSGYQVDIRASDLLDYTMAIAAKCHISNSQAEQRSTPEGETVKKVFRVIERLGDDATESNILKRANVKPWQRAEAVKVLLDGGFIARVATKSGKGNRYIVVKMLT